MKKQYLVAIISSIALSSLTAYGLNPESSQSGVSESSLLDAQVSALMRTLDINRLGSRILAAMGGEYAKYAAGKHDLEQSEHTECDECAEEIQESERRNQEALTRAQGLNFEKVVASLLTRDLTVDDVESWSDAVSTPLGKKVIRLLPTIVSEVWISLLAIQEGDIAIANEYSSSDHFDTSENEDNGWLGLLLNQIASVEEALGRKIVEKVHYRCVTDQIEKNQTDDQIEQTCDGVKSRVLKTLPGVYLACECAGLTIDQAVLMVADVISRHFTTEELEQLSVFFDQHSCTLLAFVASDELVTAYGELFGVLSSDDVRSASKANPEVLGQLAKRLLDGNRGKFTNALGFKVGEGFAQECINALSSDDELYGIMEIWCYGKMDKAVRSADISDSVAMTEIESALSEMLGDYFTEKEAQQLIEFLNTQAGRKIKLLSSHMNSDNFRAFSKNARIAVRSAALHKLEKAMGTNGLEDRIALYQQWLSAATEVYSEAEAGE